MTFKVSGSHLNYPIRFVEVSHNGEYDVEGFTVKSYLLDHAVDSFMYVFIEPDKLGALDSGKLKDIGIMPGPVYRDIKNSRTFQHDGETYDTADFLSPPVKGRKVAVHGDTRTIDRTDYLELLDGADLIVHEATYLEGEQEKAHQYFHSEINGVLNNLSGISYGRLLLGHISNRYDAEMIQSVEDRLGDRAILAHDYLEITIPRDLR